MIDALDHNILLYASAGTGKTFTVANRVANILAQKRARAEEILCLTFTIKAANEMKEDILGYVGREGTDVCVNTIHGFCYKLLVEEGKRTGNATPASDVCDEIDQEEILRSILSSRYYYWRAEANLKAQGVENVRLENAPVCKLKTGDALYFRVEDKLIDGKGVALDTPTDAELDIPTAHCPVCNDTREVKGRSCAVCGEELIFQFPEKSFEIYHRKAALRNLISELKHLREAQGYYSEDEEKDFLAAYAYLQKHEREKYEGLVSRYAKYVGLVPDEEFAAATEAFIGKLTAEYHAHLRSSNLYDFDDLILMANQILSTSTGAEYWSKRYKYIVVDEMQDTSELEYSVLKKAFGENNVMLCGDFFQTIYGWRGSRPLKILEEYARDFQVERYMLSENYRATKTLAEASFGYLKNTYPQWIGKYCPDRLQIRSEEDGEKILCYAYGSYEQEAFQIYKYLLAQKREKFGDVCVIARTNKYIARLSAYFQRFNAERAKEDGLSFFTVEENFQFFKKPVVKDILAVFRLLLNPYDRVSMERLTEKFVRQVGKKRIEELRGRSDIGVSIVSFVDERTYLRGDPYLPLIDGYKQENIVVYDTETTGLDLSKDQIVQISAIKLDGKGNIVDTLDSMIVPTVEISSAAFETHGFSMEYIRKHGGVTTKEGLGRFSAFCEGAVLVGHNNLAYDRILVDRQLRENGLPPLTVAAEYDTLLLAKQFYPNLDNYKLSTLCEKFAIVNECAHNALGDITATAKCLTEMLRTKILPTALERATYLAKYTPRFQKFYQFMQETRRRLDCGEELPAYIIERLTLEKRYPEVADRNAMRDIVLGLNLPTEDRRAFLKEYLQDAALSGSQMDVLVEKLNKIPVITVHQAKGCEFDTVVLAGADDDNFPSYAARQSGDEEEEKKVFYVAITRAKKKLILTRAMHNGRYDVGETPYFWNIPEEYVRQNRAWKNGN